MVIQVKKPLEIDKDQNKEIDSSMQEHENEEIVQSSMEFRVRPH
jgi:hypothetical protein